MKDFSIKYHPYFIAIFIVAIAFLTFKNVLNHDFFDTWDDNHHILKNEDIKSLHPDNIIKIFKTSYVDMYQPINQISYNINYAISELNPFGFHLFNLILHLGVSIMMYLFLIKLGCTPVRSGIITLLFATNVLATEPVAWISARAIVFSAILIFTGLWTYTVYLTKSRTFFLALTVIIYLFSLFTRITVVVFPFLLILLEWYLGFSWRSRRLLLNKAILIIISIPVVWISLTFKQLTDSGTTFQQIAFHIVPKILWYLDFWIPVQPHSILYNWPEWFELRHISSVILLASLILIYFRFPDYRRIILFGLAFFLVSIGPYLILSVELSPTADRYGYIPLFGIYYIIGTILFDTLKSNKVRIKTTGFIIFLLLVLLNIRASSTYINMWQSSLTIWDNSARTIPDKSMIHTKLGWCYASSGQFSKAEKEWTLATELDPTDEFLFYNLASIKFILGRYNESIQDFNKAIEISSSPYFIAARGKAYYNLDSCQMAIDDFNKSISMMSTPDPQLYYLRAVCKIETGEDPCADLNNALKFGETNALYYIKNYCQ